MIECNKQLGSKGMEFDFNVCVDEATISAVILHFLLCIAETKYTTRETFGGLDYSVVVVVVESILFHPHISHMTMLHCIKN